MNRTAAKAFKMLGMALIVPGLISGCTVFPRQEAPRVMDFPVPDGLQKSDTEQPQRLRINTPSASEPYDGTKILAKPDPWEIRVYGGVRWRDTKPVILRDMLAGAFRESTTFRDVATDASPGNTDVTLATDITAFHAVINGDTARVTIAIYGQLVDNRSRETFCSDHFVVSTPVNDQNIESVVQAFGSAGKRLSQEVIKWAGACDGLPD